MLQRTRILLHSHFFVVKNPAPNIIPSIYHLSSEYTEHGYEWDPKTRKQVWKPLKTYAVYIDGGREFRFHISLWNEFKTLLDRNFVSPAEYDLEVVPLKKPAEVELKVRENWIPRQEQEEAISFALDDSVEGHRSPLINIPMCKGKTLLSLVAVARRGYRFGVVVLAQYLDKWVDDIAKVLEVDKSEIGVIKGSDILARTTLYPDSGKTIPKAFVISLPTMGRWYSIYEEDRESSALEAFSCKVDEFCEHLGIGTLIFDEVHLHPHAIYRMHCYLHVEKIISLSATMLAQQRVLQRIQGKMFPRHRRFDSIQMDRYITTYACAYQIMNFNQSNITTKEHGRSNYSQSAFEKSLIRHKNVLKQYIEMVMGLIETAYIEKYMEGDKLIVFVGTVKMAQLMTDAIKKLWPKYDTRTYLEGDPYENVIDPDIRVTTVIGGGTAVDIPLLRRAIMTTSLDSQNSNVQALGRLRELKDRDVEFYYLYCTNIQKQCDYHKRKVELFRHRTKAQKEVFLGTLYP